MWSDLLKDKNSFQSGQLHRFLQRGFPSRKEERWKYLDISSLSKKTFHQATLIDEKAPALMVKKKREQYPHHQFFVFVNGLFSSPLSDIHLMPEGLHLTIESTSEQEWDVKHHPFAVLNEALLTEKIFLNVSRNCKLTMPLHLLFLQTQDEQFINCPRYSVHVEENCEMTIIEEHTSYLAKNYFTNTVVEIHAGAQSTINYHKIQQEEVSAVHIANIHINQARDSNVTCFNFTTGSKLAREDLHVFQNEPGCHCQLYGFYKLTEDNQQIDHHVYVNHLAPLGTSKMLYKGILDKKSRAIFNGKVQVTKAAQKINAYQANHNLLLSSEAEINSKPELEIYADEVKCAHGATIGQLDQDALFYLQSRGVERKIANALLLQAFAEDVISQLKCKSLMRNIRELYD
jgi:Fe-S cluster assembly protein SufD